MHAPWYQVTNEIIDLVAPDLACMLDGDELRMLGGLMRMIRWGLGRCPEDAPPSANDVVKGPAAAKLIARAAGYSGDPDTFISACEAVQPAILERVPDGVRFRGFDRYDPMWGKNNPDAWRAWKLANSPEPRTTAPEPGRNRAETEPEPVPQTQTQTQKKETHVEQARPAGAVGEVFGFWQQHFKHPRAVLDGKRKRAIEGRLAEGRTVEDLKQAVRGCALTPHNQGHNDRGQAYDDIELICRDAPHVERFMQNALDPPTGPPRNGAAEQTQTKVFR